MAYALYLILASLAVLAITELGKTKDRSRHMRIPTVRFSILLPNVLNRLIFFVVGSRLIHRGYKKYPSDAFRVLKADGDLIVLPRHFADELKGMGPNRLSSLDAQFENILGNYTKILVESHLPPQTVSRRLIPKLGYLTPQILSELDKAFELEFPKCGNQWTPLNPYEFFIRLLTRSTSRLLAGNEICKNEELPDLVSKYTLNMGLTLVLLRPFPDFMRPAVSWLLPSAWRLNKIMETVKASFVPVIKSRLAAKNDQATEEKPEDYLQWLVDLCDNDRDADPNFMAHNLFIIMALAVVHTSTMALTQTMYDLVLHQSCLPALRKEIKTCLTQSWKASSLNDFHSMHRLDSFLRESQRFNPSQEVTMHRIVKTPIRLSNGLYLPEGIHICFASGPMGHDPTIIPDPETFSPFRWSDGPERKSLIAIGQENMHFGYGRQSCPGRALASASMKMVLSRILSEHELMFEDQDKPGKVVKRPWNLRNGEQILPNPWTEVYVRKLQAIENEAGEVEKETWVRVE